MKNKFLIISLAMGSIALSQHKIKCSYKCGYNQTEDGTTIHHNKCDITKGVTTCREYRCDSVIKPPHYLCITHTKKHLNGEIVYVRHQWWDEKWDEKYSRK